MEKGLTETMDLPEKCDIRQEKDKIIVKGPKGELVRTLPDKVLKIQKKDGEITLSYAKSTKREKRTLFTTKAHIRNMFKGVQEGYVYKLKICSGHFPMTVTYKNDIVEIKNFIGEKVPRTLKIKPGVSLKIEADLITIESNDKELAGQAAGSIEKMTRRPGFDKRIFQDGIYIIEKDGKKI